jgi:hypothetical protein
VSNISGSPVNYSGGGGGGSSDATAGGAGAAGGGNGGDGGTSGTPGYNASNNTGSGGGGGGTGGTGTAAGGAGGSGIVIIRYLTPQTSTDANGNYNYTFTAPSTPGNYEIKVNITYNGMSAEATGTLTVITSGSNGVNCTAYKCFITRSSGNPVVIFDALGAVDLKASLTQSASGSPGANDFIIRNSTGSAVAWINASGNLLIKGTLSENNGVACTPPANSFFIKGNNSECVAYVNNTGDLWLKGDLRENVLT